MVEEVEDRMRLLENELRKELGSARLELELMKQDVTHVKKSVDKLNETLGKILWIIGGGFLVSLVTWIINGGLVPH